MAFVRKNYIFSALLVLMLGVTTLLWDSVVHSAPLAVNIGGWFPTAPLPQLLASRVAVVKGDILFVIGGKTPSDKPSAEVYTAQLQADGSLNSWGSTTPLPVPVYLHAAAATATHLYVIGGWDASRGDCCTRADVWRAPFTSNGVGTWEKISDYPIALDLHDAAIVNNRLYVIGGWNGKAPLSKVYYAEIQANGLGAWTPALDLPAPLYRLAVTATNGVLYVTGGYNDTAQATVYYARVNNDGSLASWQQTTKLPEARYYHKVVVQDGKLVVLGGKNDTTEFSSVYAAPLNLDGSVGAWSAQPDLPESLYRFAAVTVNKNSSDYIYVFGGLHNLSYRQNVYHSAVPTAPTPTSTPTPGPTPTPTPGITLRLDNNPQHWVAPGEEIAYTIAYQNRGVNNAQNVVIASTIPAETELVDGSIVAGPSANFSITGANAGDTISWELGNLASTASGTVGYRVRRIAGTNSSVARAVSIQASGPATVNQGAQIDYQITVTNNVPLTLTNVTVFNALPEGATYIGGADGPPANNLVKWTMPSLKPDSTVTLKLSVSAPRSIINNNYWVTTEEGASAQGSALVITLVGNTPLPASGDGVSIINAKALLNWSANNQSHQATSNAVFNPSFPVFLPLVNK
ncbi:MAG: hypothetical protein U0350_05335 [Caldilineaceae bacterium]